MSEIEHYQTDRERLEAGASPALLTLADEFRDKLDELGWHTMAQRRALLLTLAEIATRSQSERVSRLEEADLRTHDLALLVRDVLRCAWSLCDGTEYRQRPHVQPEDWNALSASLDALEEATRAVEPSADAGHAATILIRYLPCVHGVTPAERCSMNLSRGCEGPPRLARSAINQSNGGGDGR